MVSPRLNQQVRRVPTKLDGQLQAQASYCLLRQLYGVDDDDEDFRGSILV
jgi:hypothetical protein